ncbi:hypothetical protein QBC47DRAFT_370795 [Echria macrotheca]|uniref:NAD(P)-binding domain-containing protein n=1 Tax=Echria macrotheca TaxID=438768 RepID=A0AAJ0BKM3_9PEZI|nr:hypothetical protein QBC47DRAFT_370795 [Echria macrotheca]
MHITVVPASPRTAQATIRFLLAHPSGPTVRGVYRDLARVPAEFAANPKFAAVTGDIIDASSLDFAGSDAVLNVQPPIYAEIDTVKHALDVSNNIKAAVQRATSVKRLVFVSSMGAQYDHGTGEILTSHAAETVLADAAPEVVFVRCAYFMHNWEAALKTISEAGFFFTTLTPLDNTLPQVAKDDIGETCAEELLATGNPLKSNPYIFDLVGPRPYTSLDVQRAWEEATGKTLEMRPVGKDGLAEFYGHVFPPVVAKRYTEMNLSFLPGGIIYEQSQPTGEVRKGRVELVDEFRKLLQGA